MTLLENIRYRIGDTKSPYVFEDEELETIITSNTGDTDNETILLSSVFCVKALLADSAKRFNYKQENSSVNASDIFEHYKSLLSELTNELAVALGGEDTFILDRMADSVEDYEMEV